MMYYRFAVRGPGNVLQTHDVIRATQIVTLVQPEGHNLYIRKEICPSTVSSVCEVVLELSLVPEFEQKSCCYAAK
jgi:hypothetical protein